MDRLTSVRTLQKLHTRGNGEMSFMSREIINFPFFNRKNHFRSIIQEVAFDEVEVDEMKSNDKGELVPTGRKLKQRVFLEVIREIPRDIKTEQSNMLFTANGKDIKTTEQFVQRFLDIQRKGLMIDSNGSVFGSVPKNSFVVDDFDGNYVNKVFNPNYM